jgi:hypothetical protein
MYERAAEIGDPEAINSLGALLFDGLVRYPVVRCAAAAGR